MGRASRTKRERKEKRPVPEPAIVMAPTKVETEKPMPEETPTSWKPQTRVVAGGGVGLAIANIIAYYAALPENVEASLAVIITCLVTYLWSDKLLGSKT